MGRAVRVTESDQRHGEATVLWWISIFKADGRKGEEAGGSLWAPLTLFISSITEIRGPPWTGMSATCSPYPFLHPSLSFASVFINVLILSFGVCDSNSACEHAPQAGMRGPVEICSMTEHLKTPISPETCSTFTVVSGILTCTHTHMHDLKYTNAGMSILNHSLIHSLDHSYEFTISQLIIISPCYLISLPLAADRWKWWRFLSVHRF